ncbi:STAS domain-containing protein [Streptomyces virginiae]|uniref:STAS domain-containing protein n=1 Tax=Streptomyces virginiae TaxID=1961 RepID=UPI0036E403BE
MINVGVQRCGNSVLISADGELDEDSGGVLLQALDHVTADVRDLLVDMHGVTAMDTDGLFHLLDLHRRAELLRLRVLVTGWQPQPQRFMAEVAGIAGPGTATGERYAVAGFRRLLEDRAQRARDHADFASGRLPQA